MGQKRTTSKTSSSTNNAFNNASSAFGGGSNTFDPWVTAASQQLSAESGGIKHNPFTGQRNATYAGGSTHSPLHSQAFGVAQNTDNPFSNALSGVNLDNLQGEKFDPATASSYIDMFKQASEPALTAIDDTLASSLNASNAGAGNAFGGSRHFLKNSAIAGEAAKAKGNVLSNAITSGLNFGAGQHQQNIANRMGAVNQLGGLAGQHQGIQSSVFGNLMNAGNTAVGLDQAALDRTYADSVYNNESPLRFAQGKAGVLATLPKNQNRTSFNFGTNAGTSSGTSRGRTTNTENANPFATAVGLGSVLGGSYLSNPFAFA